MWPPLTAPAHALHTSDYLATMFCNGVGEATANVKLIREPSVVPLVSLFGPNSTSFFRVENYAATLKLVHNARRRYLVRCSMRMNDVVVCTCCWQRTDEHARKVVPVLLPAAEACDGFPGIRLCDGFKLWPVADGESTACARCKKGCRVPTCMNFGCVCRTMKTDVELAEDALLESLAAMRNIGQPDYRMAANTATALGCLSDFDYQLRKMRRANPDGRQPPFGSEYKSLAGVGMDYDVVTHVRIGKERTGTIMPNDAKRAHLPL